MTVQLHRSSPRSSPRSSAGSSPGSVPMSTVQGTLALAYESLAYQSTVRSTLAPELRVLPGAREELEAFAHRFVSAVVEVVGGDRGPSQLLRWTTESVYADLQQRAALLARTTPADRRVRRLRSQVRSVHVFCPSAEAAEISVHVRRGERSRAIAARIELRSGRWCCTALQFG